MYSHIIDPISKSSNSISSSKGKSVLKKYLKYLKHNSGISKKKKGLFKKTNKKEDIDRGIVFNNIIYDTQITTSTNKKSKYDIVVFSADYDGCWDILFGPIRRVLIKNTVKGKKDYLYVRNKLVFNIKDFLKRGKEYMLLVGSARQSVEMDNYNREIHLGLHAKSGIRYKHHEGYCFRDFRNLCCHNNWTLLRFLYPDISKSSYMKVAENILLDMENCNNGIDNNNNLVWCNPKLFSEKKLISKSEIIISQINILNILYPKKKILFVFYDDDNKGTIFNEILLKLKNKKLPSNITIKLYRYNWFNILNNNDDIIEIKH